MFSSVGVGTLVLELCTSRVGEMGLLSTIPEDRRVGVGLVNPKDQRIHRLETVLARAEHAISLFGAERVLLNPDCGFATFADNPIVTAEVAEADLKVLVKARDILRERHG